MTACLRTGRIAAERHAHTGMPGPEEQRPGARSYSLEGPGQPSHRSNATRLNPAVAEHDWTTWVSWNLPTGS